MTDKRPFDSPDGSNPDPLSADDRAAVVEALVEEMGELFHGYVRGEVSFEEVSFEMFDTLQTLYAVTHGAMTIEYFDDNNDLDTLGDGSGGIRHSPNGRHGADHQDGHDGGQRRESRRDRD